MARVGRNRTRHTRFPIGWKLARGTIYFIPSNEADKEIVRRLTGGPLCLRLGKTHDEAAETFAAQIVRARKQRDDATPGTVAEIVQRAREKFLPTIKVDKTLKERTRHLDQLDALFGTRRYARNVYEASRDRSLLNATDIQKHLDRAADDVKDAAGNIVAKARPVAANREVNTWDIVFNWARTRWGFTEYNPCDGVMPNPETPRDVLPDDAQIFKLYRHLDAPARFMVAMIRYYGRRKGELLGLHLQDARDDGLHLGRGKGRNGTRKELILVWDTRLERMWARLMRWREKVKREGKLQTTAAILNRRGMPYTETGFNSARKRAMERAGIKGQFTFHDIRATRASTLSREDAVHVLAHDDPRTTARVYRRGPQIIRLVEKKPDSETSAKNSETKAGTNEKATG